MQKPVKLIEIIIKLHTKENDTVIDCFAGSGRKPLPEEQKKKYITISISGQPAEIERLKARAREEHKTVSRFILDDIK